MYSIARAGCVQSRASEEWVIDECNRVIPIFEKKNRFGFQYCNITRNIKWVKFFQKKESHQTWDQLTIANFPQKFTILRLFSSFRILFWRNHNKVTTLPDAGAAHTKRQVRQLPHHFFSRKKIILPNRTKIK